MSTKYLSIVAKSSMVKVLYFMIILKELMRVVYLRKIYLSMSKYLLEPQNGAKRQSWPDEICVGLPLA